MRGRSDSGVKIRRRSIVLCVGKVERSVVVFQIRVRSQGDDVLGTVTIDHIQGREMVGKEQCWTERRGSSNAARHVTQNGKFTVWRFPVPR